MLQSVAIVFLIIDIYKHKNMHSINEKIEKNKLEYRKSMNIFKLLCQIIISYKSNFHKSKLKMCY